MVSFAGSAGDMDTLLCIFDELTAKNLKPGRIDDLYENMDIVDETGGLVGSVDIDSGIMIRFQFHYNGAKHIIKFRGPDFSLESLKVLWEA